MNSILTIHVYVYLNQLGWSWKENWNINTNINNIKKHLSPQTIEHKNSRTHGVGDQSSVLRQTILKGPNSPPRDNCIIGLKLTPIMPYQCHCNTLTVPYKPLTITYSPHVLHMPWHSLWETQFFEQMLGSIVCKAEHTDSSISVPTHVIWSVEYVGFISAYYMKTIIPVYIVAYKYANNIYDIWYRSLTQ